jgi:hypothetical protein
LAENWQPFLRSLLARTQHAWIESHHVRARGALAALAENEPSSTLLLQARRDTAKVDRTGAPWARALATLLAAGLAQVRGDQDRAAAQLRAGIDSVTAAGMHLYAAAARRRLGQHVGGDEGVALRATADAWMSERGVANPARMTAMLIPGWAL